MKKQGNDKTFVTITNEQIYDKLCELAEHVKETNGKVKFNTKMICMCGGGIMILAGWFVSHLI